MRILLLLFVLSISSCATLPNSCVLEARAYQNYLRAKNIEGKILVVEYEGYFSSHAYLLFNTDKYLCFYDTRGSMIIGKAQKEILPEIAAYKINLLSGDFKGTLVSAKYW